MRIPQMHPHPRGYQVKDAASQHISDLPRGSPVVVSAALGSIVEERYPA